MDMTLMRSLLAVADAGVITEAAQQLGVTQSALSRRLQQLEEYFGARLLARGRSGAALTTLGELVEAEARVLVSRFDHLRDQVNAHVRLEGGTVRLGGGATAVLFIMPEAIAAFQAKFPAVRFQVKEAGSREISQDVVSGHLELGLVTLPVLSRELTVQALFDDEVVLAARTGHPLARRRPVSLAELSGLSLVGFEAGSAIRDIIDRALRDAGVEMNVVMELRSIPAIIRMVTTTGNLAFVSRLSVEADPDVLVVPVRGLNIRRKLAVVARRDTTLSPAATAFWELLVKRPSGD